MTQPIQDSGTEISERLWNLTRLGLLLLMIGIVGLAAAIALGVADPQPVGRLQWEQMWLTGADGWEAFGDGDVSIGQGRLEITVNADEVAGAVVPNPNTEFSFEIAAGQAAGEAGASYGIVFGYKGEADYTAVTINNNSYVEVVTAGGKVWMPFQQWPHILLADEANRVRVDVQDGEGLIRINDEVLMTVPVGEGAIGVIVRGTSEGQRVRVGWAKYWAR